MSSQRRTRTVTTIETHEIWVIRRPPPETPDILCVVCASKAGMLTPQEAALRAGVSQRTIYRWIEDGRIHFAETMDGGLFVCLAPLLILREGVP